jgi:hypothetical protein
MSHSTTLVPDGVPGVGMWVDFEIDAVDARGHFDRGYAERDLVGSRPGSARTRRPVSRVFETRRQRVG